jgi:hypothetical protein
MGHEETFVKLDPPDPAENRRWLLILAVLVFAEVNSSFEVGRRRRWSRRGCPADPGHRVITDKPWLTLLGSCATI